MGKKRKEMLYALIRTNMIQRLVTCRHFFQSERQQYHMAQPSIPCHL